MLHLKLMDKWGIDDYIKSVVPKIAEEYVKAGVIKREESIPAAQSIFNQYMPNGIPRPNQFIFHIVNEVNKIIGMIWYEKQAPDQGFICDFFIDEEYRGRGYGREAMELMEKHAKNNGVKKISLHVFGHNKQALSLYEKLGYIPFSLHMSKDI